MSLRNYFILASIAICAVVNSVGAIPSPSEPTTLGEQTLERRDFYGAANNAYDIAGLAKRSPYAVSPAPPQDNSLIASAKVSARRLIRLTGLENRQVVMLSQMTQGSGPSFGMSQVVAATKEWMRLLHSQETEILIICNAFPTDARVTDAMAALGAGQDYANAIIDIRSATDQATARSKFNVAMTYRSGIEAAIRTLVNIANSA
ncbi:hypothetical protein KEM48_009186 [Puccinia striiformis f. sp. tritici PST-130]|uniref:Uncharacterized protein n=1 Tax=Puccinia striiformis f. sp. tritici PST-78 TaxID=1165861 RepID=A0A0L0UTL1_9BASI|nr:hypothetical protein Pst134EB_029938 [Puccinia striiformis f. sp. tritici]KAI9623961.1 hypothetical protein KEM48_009186 [Puccinia striiformis f. sp. tritici PST-130]KNE90365.1 hypothetical protein PSTG_16188 [Puccinia striiformis f. sp. tritici PST-78]